MKLVIKFSACLLIHTALIQTQAHEWSLARADGHAPIGVMGDHTHAQDEWMVSYRFMHMDMKGHRSGDSKISTSDVLTGFPVAPTRMSMNMHMIGLMYAPLDNLTLMAMLPYTFLEMDHVTRTGVRFTTRSEGVGDVRLGGLLDLYKSDNHRVHLNLGGSFPTGSTDAKDDTPAQANANLPYPMQLGSGTWDLQPGVTYLGQTDRWSWGGQTLATIRLGRNDEDYSLGDRLELTGWVARSLCKNASISFRLDGQTWGNIDGSDGRLNPAMVPTADPNRRGGTRLDALLGLNLYLDLDALSYHRLAIEGGVPIYQHLEGPQLENDWVLTAGWQFAW